jgi:D-3-phosphoglycerate dehydrogenase / 2-oxoglutarate reductase
MGYILSFARNLPWMSEAMHGRIWHKIPGRALSECSLGVIGIGNIGKAVISRARSFDMNVLGNDIVEISKDFLSETKVQMVSKEELIRQADFIGLTCDLNPTSFHLIDADDFSLMKPSAVIINTARGPIINEPALVKALQEKQIAGAALDVFETEPLPNNSPLLQMDNVLLAPHNANSSPEAWERVHENTIQNLIEELQRANR